MKNDLLLSVIVPVYNVAPYLHKCLDSILCQTYRNLEIILVADGGSTDGSTEICEAYAAKDARIKLLHRPHEGLVSARKAGVAAASGQYAAYVDGDDWIDVDAYERLLSLVTDHEPDVLIYGFIEEYQTRAFVCPCMIPAGYYDADGMMREVYPRLLSLRYADQLAVSPGTGYDAAVKTGQGSRRCHQPEIYSSVWSKLVKRELLRQTQEMVQDYVTMGEDLVCTVYTLLSARSVTVTDYAPYHYQMRDDSASLSNVSFQPYQAMFEAADSALQNSPMRETHLMQLYAVLLDYVLLTQYEAFLQDEFSNFPFGNLNGRRMALYGAGKFGREIFRKTKALFPDRITLWVDQNYKTYQAADLPVEPVSRLLEAEYDIVVIALINEALCEEIKEHLTAVGVDGEKIRYVSVSLELLDATKRILQKQRNRLNKTKD